MTSHHLSADLVVVGGGLAGICAAIAASRNGISVVLVQDRSVLGGNASSEIRMHIVGADCHGTRPGARESGIIEELRLEDAARNPHRSYSQWDLLLYEKVISEKNIILLLDTDCVGCDWHEEADGRRRISVLHAVRNATEDRFTIAGAFFADCSGDSRLAMEAGAHFMVGREAKSEFGESLALDVADRQTLGASILYTARQYPTPQSFSAPSWVRPFTKEEFKFRPIRNYEYGFWWSEWGGQLDMIKEAPKIRHELLRIALGIWDYVKNSGEHPDSANWALEWVGAIPGKRESRRLVGPYVLTQQDVEGGRVFDDQVAYGGWWLDLHPPSGVDAHDQEPCVQLEFPHLYSIPLRALYSRNVTNLFFAGRNLSATHVAFASTRVMGTCSVAGQAIGTAAAVARRVGGSAISDIFTPAIVHELQRRLMRDDAFLLGLSGSDLDDAAQSADLKASSEQPASPVSSLTDGFTRELFAHLGVWSDGGTHRWESRSLPAWFELTWATPRTINSVHLTFDSGFQRELILSASDSTTRRVVRGPQPELVRAYDILADDHLVLSVENNLARKQIHRFAEPIVASRLRVQVRASHDFPVARVFEVRVY